MGRTAAAQLDNGTRSSLEKALRGSETVKKAQNAKFSYVVNEGIIGGLIVDIGGERSIDLSTSHRVNKINAQLNRASTR